MLRNNWKFILIGMMMMFIPLATGAAYPIQSAPGTPVTQDPVVGNYTQQVYNSVFYQPFNLYSVFTVFGANAWTSLFIFASGIAVLPSAMIMGLNGFEVGYFIHFLSINTSPLIAATVTLPHGVVELLSYGFCAAGGMRVFWSAFSYVKQRYRKAPLMFAPKPRDSFGVNMNNAIYLFLIGLGLLFLAAILETYLTPFLIGLLP